VDKYSHQLPSIPWAIPAFLNSLVKNKMSLEALFYVSWGNKPFENKSFLWEGQFLKNDRNKSVRKAGEKRLPISKLHYPKLTADFRPQPFERQSITSF
jgi:hypothetical protein